MGLRRNVLRFLILGASSTLLAVLAARLWDEFIEETQGVDEAEQIELDRIVLPGISIRS